MARLTGLEPATPGVTGRYSNQLSYNRAFISADIRHALRAGPDPLAGPTGRVKVARLTGLEPATPGVTGRYSNQLSYNRTFIWLAPDPLRGGPDLPYGPDRMGSSGAVDGARTRDPRRDRPVL